MVHALFPALGRQGQTELLTKYPVSEIYFKKRKEREKKKGTNGPVMNCWREHKMAVIVMSVINM